MRMMRLKTIWILAAGLVLVGTVPADADIYRYVDARGVLHFTNTPTTGNFTLYLKETPVGDRSGDSGNLAEIIQNCCSLYGLEEALVQAVIKVESDYNPRAVSSKGAQGMMQLVPETARDMQVADPFDPAQNIRGGSRYLRLMLDQFSDDLELALAAYNAGPNAVRRHGGVPPFPETVNYVDKVKKYLHYYRSNRDSRL